MQRKFISNLIILQLLNWLIKPVWIFWIEVKVQNTLGNIWYGEYYAVFGLALLFNILLDFGLNNYVASRVAQSNEHHSPGRIFRLRMLLALFYIVLVALFGLLQHMEPWLLGLVVLNQLLASFTLFYRAVLQGRQLFRTDSLASVADRLVAILVIGWFIGTGAFNAYNGLKIFLLAQTAGYVVALCFSWYYSKRGTVISADGETKLRDLLKSTAWFAVLAFAMAVFTRIDTQMLKNMVNDGAVGGYARSFRFLDAALIFSTLISSQLLPLFSRMLSKSENTDGLIWLNTRIILLVALPLAATGAYFGADILNLFYHTGVNSCSPKSRVFHLLMVSFIPMAMVHVFGTWLTAAGKLKFLSFSAMGCMLLNVGLNFWLIPRYGALGTAMACLITQSVFALLCIAGTIKNNGFHFTLKRLLQLLLWSAAAEVVFGLWHLQGSGLLMLTAAGASWFIAVLLTGMFWPELKKFAKRGA